MNAPSGSETFSGSENDICEQISQLFRVMSLFTPSFALINSSVATEGGGTGGYVPTLPGQCPIIGFAQIRSFLFFGVEDRLATNLRREAFDSCKLSV